MALRLRPRLIRGNSPGKQLFLCGGIRFPGDLTVIDIRFFLDIL